MHPNAALIESFYQAFQRRDGDAMAACYHRDVRFSDPVFTELHGERAAGMWRMFCSRKNSDLKVVYRDVRADDERGSAHWDATYTFPKTGRLVTNSIDASFQFRDGKIIRHDDRFDLYKWTRMALGPVGVVLGWTPFLQKSVSKQGIAQLDRFMESR